MQNVAKLLLILVFLVFALIGFQAFTVLLQKTLPMGIKSTTIQLAAVDEEDRGVLLPMQVEIKPGDGKILMNIDNPSFITDTQDSMRLAALEASRITGYMLDTIDIIFSLKTNITIVGGPSAGAAMTAAVISSLTDKPLRPDVVITGTIEEGGFIGQVGGIAAKAEAAKKAGITTFVVPEGESVVNEPVQECTEKRGEGWRQRECVIVEREVNVSEQVGIDVVEARTIQDALKYLLA